MQAQPKASGNDPQAEDAGIVQLRDLLHFLETGLLERDAAARLVLMAAVAGEHVLLIGPPGTAKSELARRLQAIVDADTHAPATPYFERLLTRFSTPEELFGPLSLKALEEDRYERLVEGYLPTAQVAFLDEVFKANSAILNALLTLLNERAFDNGTGRSPVPLVTVVAASNEVPGDEALQAFHDRFLLRVPVEPVGDAAFDALLAPAPAAPVPPMHGLNADLRRSIKATSQAVILDPSAHQALHRLRAWVQTRSWRVSDRRWRQFAQMLRVAAAAEGRSAVVAADLWLSAYVLPTEPAHTAELLEVWRHDLLDAGQADEPGLRRTTEAFEKQLEIETRAQAEEGADGAGKVALARSIGGADGDGAQSEMLRLYSARVEEQLRKRWSPLHVQARLAQVQELAHRVELARSQAQAALEALTAQLQGRLWLPPSLAEATLAPPQQRLALLEDLGLRLAAARQGFADLPLDEALSNSPLPMPVHA